jgi:hypothetical protein
MKDALGQNKILVLLFVILCFPPIPLDIERPASIQPNLIMSRPTMWGRSPFNEGSIVALIRSVEARNRDFG